jgi:hypothetical protein
MVEPVQEPPVVVDAPVAPPKRRGRPPRVIITEEPVMDPVFIAPTAPPMPTEEVATPFVPLKPMPLQSAPYTPPPVRAMQPAYTVPSTHTPPSRPPVVAPSVAEPVQVPVSEMPVAIVPAPTPVAPIPAPSKDITILVEIPQIQARSDAPITPPADTPAPQEKRKGWWQRVIDGE